MCGSKDFRQKQDHTATKLISSHIYISYNRIFIFLSCSSRICVYALQYMRIQTHFFRAWESTWGRVRGGDNSHCERFLGSLRWAICSSGQAHSTCSLNVNSVSFLTRDSSNGKTRNCPRVTTATIYKAFTVDQLTSFNPQNSYCIIACFVRDGRRFRELQ